MTAREGCRAPHECATFCEQRQSETKLVVTQILASYPVGMQFLRSLISCLVIAVVAAISVNGIAMAANDLGHQTHCIDTIGGYSDETTTGHAHDDGHDDTDLVTQHATPNHDHEACMMHACPGLSANAIKIEEIADVFLAKLTWPERSMYLFERTDGLKRPPKT